jgi:1-aminocyclopropane-1-carboxylate deaminase/D-cysteine desulfhydrase-like pyridoxal-dependent ACC family enzyme
VKERRSPVPLGGSVPLGALGFVRGVEEPERQLDAMNVEIDHIFHSCSSGGTQAGIVAGCQLLDWQNVKDIGVSPDSGCARASAVEALFH